MPIRRPSHASSAFPAANANFVTGRMHRSTDSHHVLNSLSSSQQHSILSLGASATPQQKIVQVLVTRLKNKLPCNSGVSLDRLETDTVTQQIVEALVEISRNSVDMIAWALSELLDRLAKVKMQTDTTAVPIEILQSQLFILKVLSMTMASRWTQTHRSESYNGGYSPSSTYDYYEVHRTSQRKPQVSTEQTPQQSSWSEPPAMENHCAQYILSVMVLFLRQTSSPEVPLVFNRSGDISFRDYESHDIPVSEAAENQYISSAEFVSKAQPSSTSIRPGTLCINTTAFIPATNAVYEKTHMSLVKLTSSVNILIAKYAARVIFHISASNWTVVFNRLRNRIRHIAEHTEDNPDVVDLQIMAHSVLDRQRLSQLLNELSSLLVNMTQDAQFAVAVPLRMAIWNWIDMFPTEFNDVIRNKAKVENAPEKVFDLLYSRNPTGNDKTFWPTLTLLNCITYERISNSSNLSGIQKSPKKFLEDVMKHTAQGSKSDMSFACAVDICRVAMHIPSDIDIPLRMAAFEIAHDIKAKLFNSGARKPFYDTIEEIDVALYADALVSIFRFLPLEDSLPVFSDFVQTERSEAVKLCVVRACLTIVQEASRFPWQRPLDELEDMMEVRLRDLMKNTFRRVGQPKKNSTRPRIKRHTPDHLSDRDICLLGVFSLWRVNPNFVLKSPSGIDMEQWNASTAVFWETDIDISVKISMANCLRGFSDSLFQNPPESSEHPMLKILKLSWPATFLSVCKQLLECRADFESQRLWMGIAHQILEPYVKKTSSAVMKEFQCDPNRSLSLTLAEITFLVCLTSADLGVSKLAGRGLRLLSHADRELNHPTNSDVADEDRSKRNPIYEQLGDPSIAVVGRIGHQKRIRKLVRLLSCSSIIHIAVWEECYWRWKSLCEILFENIKNQNSVLPHGIRAQSDTAFQWQNLTLFLAVLTCSSYQDKAKFTTLKNIIPQNFIPDSTHVLQNPNVLVDEFLSVLIKSLTSSSMLVRDVARDALGAEFSPRMYTKILRLLEESLASNEQTSDAELSDAYMLYLDQIASVLKLLVERSATPEDVMNVDISSIMITLVNLIARFQGTESFRIKIKFSMLCESVCGLSEVFTLRKDSFSRQTILNVMLDWMEPQSNAGDTNLLSLYHDMNIACLRATVVCLDRMQLRPVEATSTGDDSAHVISRLFNKYSGSLLQNLMVCQQEFIDNVSSNGNRSTKKSRASQREAEIRELVITGLSHMVSANNETGFKQCLPLAYDQDNRKRAIFAHVFARVIGEGASFEPEDRSAAQARHARVCDLLRAADMTLVLAICEVCPASEVEMMVSVLLNIFDTRTSLINLMKVMIEREVGQTDNEASLFRSNSTCTRFFSAFARVHGYNYLRSLIHPLVELMAKMPEDYSYEIDPTKVSLEEAIANQKNVEYVAQTFLSIMSSSLQTLPNMFREICAHIAQVVTDVWPEAKFSATGGFMFLRFISPAVVAPETVDVEVPKGENTIVMRRGLMVIAKIIQNLANNIFFGKEAHMVVLNKFLEGNIANVTRFLIELHRFAPAISEEDNDQWQGTTSDETDIIVLHRFFQKHADKIGKELLSLSRPSHEGDVSGKRAWDGLCALLVDFGTPLEVPRPSMLNTTEHEEYIGLMMRYKKRNTDTVKGLFVETGVPLGRPAVFVLRLSTIDVEALDVELLMYHIFKTLDLPAYNGRMFDIILDCTSFTSMSEVPLQWLKYCAELIPSDVRSRFATTYILNPNSLMQKYLRRLYNISAGIPFCSDVQVLTSVSELLEYVPIQALSPLIYPSSLEQEPLEEFKDVTIKVTHMRLPIILKVGASHLRVTSIKTQAISPGLSCKSTEIMPLTDISDVYNVSTGQEPHEFIIRRRQGLTVYFSSASRDLIVKTIRSAKGRLKEVQAPLTERFSRFSNVPATLLHVGLLSVDPNDEELRGAAYDLLDAVCCYLKYDKSPIVACKAGFIPGDPLIFAVTLSEKLSEYAPQLTLDFIHEVSAAMTGMDMGAMTQRITCLQYMSPWIRNMSHFCNAVHPLYERSGARLRDCIRTLLDLSVAFPEITSTIQKNIWLEVSKLDSLVVDIILDELVRTATDGGLGTRRCETITHIVATMSSINVRGRIYSKLRKTLSKMPPKLANTLSEHPNWTELSTLIQLALVVGSQSNQLSSCQLYVPEIIHLTALLAGEGPSNVRKSVYGIIVNLLQSLHMARSEDSPQTELLQLISHCALPETLKLFGLQRATPTSEYRIVDPTDDRDGLDILERLGAFLVRVMETTAGSIGLLNVWRARWMSLVTSTAFQLSPAVQTRSFIAIGALAVADVDDDFIYQILVAFRSALSKANETHTMSIVSMLRCMCVVVPAMQENSRHICHFFWLAVALLQSSHFAFYVEATCLLRKTLEHMEAQGMFKNNSVAAVLLEARLPLDDIATQLDDMLRISFDTNFSFSMAAIIFKGMRHKSLKESAESVLRSLLRVTVRSHISLSSIPNAFKDTLNPDVLGYFLALFPASTLPASYRHLLKDCNIDEAWAPDTGFPEYDIDDRAVPRVTIDFLGVNDSNTALLTASSVGTMLTTAQGDDAETEMLYNLLAQLAESYPGTISIIYESMQDRIKDTFANAANSSILRSVSTIFRVAMQGAPQYHHNHNNGSSTSLNVVDENVSGAGRSHLNALDELGMQGLSSSFQFLPLNRGHATKMINWIPSLVALMIG